MAEWAIEMLRYGPLGAFALAVCWGGWIILMRGGTKAYGLAERHVLATESLVEKTEKQNETLRVSMETQQVLCARHGQASDQIADNVSSHDMAMRSAMRSACVMCRTVAAKEFPNSAARVDEHTREIERIIGEA